MKTTYVERCVDRVRKENFADGTLPEIHIFGCPEKHPEKIKEIADQYV